MAVVRPFKAVRPAPDKVAEVITLPYDVMDREEAAKMAEGKPNSFLHITRAEIDLPETEDPYCSRVYQRGRENMERFIASGILTEEAKPALYIYRQEMDGRFQTGIAACCSIDEYENNTIKKHELTRYDKELDRINHFDTCDGNTEPVFLTYRAKAEIEEAVDRFMAEHSPVYDLHTEDGIGHTLWVIDDEQVIDTICTAFSDVDALYIADGHHRSASAYEVGKRRRKACPDYDGTEEFNFFMAMLYPDSHLKVFDYNRVIKDLNGNTPEEFLAAVEAAGFAVTDEGEEIYRPQRTHEFSLYLAGRWYRLTAAEEIVPDDAVGALDVSILQNRVLHPILGISDPRSDSRIDFVGGIRGLGELKRRVEKDMTLAFALYPVTIKELMDIADCGEIMPPKSTWFEPKPASGLFFHKF